MMQHSALMQEHVEPVQRAATDYGLVNPPAKVSASRNLS